MKTDSMAYTPSTERTRALKDAVMAAPREISTARAKIFTKSDRENKDKPLLIRRALAYKAMLEEMPIVIHDHEILVGGITEKRRGAFLVPETNVEGMSLGSRYNQVVKKGMGKVIDAASDMTNLFNKSLATKLSTANLLMEQSLDNLENRSSQQFAITPEEKNDIENVILPYWKTRDAISLYRTFLTPEKKKLMNQFTYAAEHQFVGGVFLFNPNLENAFDKGLNVIIADAENRIIELEGADHHDKEKADFYEAVIISCRAVIHFAYRYADLAESMAATENDAKRKAELLEIARIFRHVPANPPGTFQEGLQSLWLNYLAVLLDDGGHEVPFGRWDQLLFPLYKKDLENGTISRSETLELLEAFLIKTNEIEFMLHNKARLFEDGNSGRITLTIGGVDENGNDATNELSYLFLDALSNTRMVRPNPAVRLHRNTPERFIQRVTEIMASGANTIQVFNDESIIKGFMDNGFSARDARDYIISGCVEQIPRATYGSVCASHLVLPRALEIYLRKNTNVSTYDEFLSGYKAYLSKIIKNITETLSIVDQAHKERVPNTFISALAEGPMENGRDVKNGGADKNLTGVSLLGLGSATDGLMVIKKAVFEDRRFSLAELKKMMANDYQKYEAQRQYILNKIPKYGNDDNKVDLIAKDLVDFFSSELKQYKTYRGGQYVLGAHSENGQVVFGFVTGATPDGRKQLAPLSIGAIGAQGREKQGYTAVLNSVSKLDPSNLIGGVSVNLRFNNTSLDTADKRQRFSDMLKAYFFSRGGQNLQTTVVGTETLKAAQEHPENYQDLLVRISGYSAQFTGLTRYTQDEIISRTGH